MRTVNMGPNKHSIDLAGSIPSCGCIRTLLSSFLSQTLRLVRMVPFFRHFIYVLLIFLVTNTHVVMGEKITRKRRDPNKKYPDHCKCHPHDGKGGRIAYLILVHSKRTIEDAVPLIKSIWGPRTIIIIHIGMCTSGVLFVFCEYLGIYSSHSSSPLNIDRKTPWEDYETSELHRMIKDNSCRTCGADIHVESKFDARWGTWSMNDATLWAMEKLVYNPRYENKWDAMINLSGDTLSVYTPQKLSRLFDPSAERSLSGINFVTSSGCATGLIPTNILHFPYNWAKRVHYERFGEFILNHIDKEGTERVTTNLTIHFGSQWMILTPKFVEYIVNELQMEDSLANVFKKELISREMIMSDEAFIPTLLANHEEFKTTLPQTLPSGDLEIMPEISAVR